MKKSCFFFFLLALALLLSGCQITSRELAAPEQAGPVSTVASAEAAAPSAFPSAGDIVLSDGSIVAAGSYTAIDAANPPAAVLVGTYNGRMLGVGVHRSETPLPWAAAGSEGTARRFADILCIAGSDSAFTGDLDGSDNWDVICAQDAAGSAEAAEAYPAFAFMERYAASYRLEGPLAAGWYIPSIAELALIYQNRAAIDASLQRIARLDAAAAMDGLGSNWYWSSSQAGVADDYAWFIHYFNGYAGECPKDFDNLHVLVVHAF